MPGKDNKEIWAEQHSDQYMGCIHCKESRRRIFLWGMKHIVVSFVRNIIPGNVLLAGLENVVRNINDWKISNA